MIHWRRLYERIAGWGYHRLLPDSELFTSIIYQKNIAPTCSGHQDRELSDKILLHILRSIH